MTTRIRPASPVVNFDRSPFAKLKALDIASVTLTDNFWEPRIRLNREVTIPGQLRQCQETGRIENFERAAGRSSGPFQGIFFNDSDVYKWAEAAAFSLSTHPDSELDAKLDAVIEVIAAAQQSDGYLNTYFMFKRAGERYSNLKDMHELYCAGHLIQAAVAHSRATGKRNLLNVACRLADHLYDVFGPGKRSGACGHEEAEMALVELYRTVGDNRYLELAKLMVDARGQTPPILGGAKYHQDHLPFVEQTEFIGHAVRHLYYVCGAADVLAEQGAPEYRKALETLWDDLTRRKMYVTGGAGSRYEGEAFGAAYELPAERAYTETCAAIASVMWNWRMLNLTGEARFADLLEWTLYNAVLPGLSLDGSHYFYQNPLADRGSHRRQAWFGCACCPPNVARMLASLPGYFYSTADSTIYAHLYATHEATVPVEDGSVEIRQNTQYPWDGTVEIQAKLVGVNCAALRLRVPGWAEGAGLTLNGKARPINASPAGSYVEVALTGDDVIVLELPMPVERIAAHAHVTSCLGRIALTRGPLVYCIEAADHTDQDVDVLDIALPDDAEFEEKFVSELLGGAVMLSAEALAISPASKALYSRYAPSEPLEAVPVTLSAIPYFLWANREAGPMQVWIPTLPADDESELDASDEYYE